MSLYIKGWYILGGVDSGRAHIDIFKRGEENILGGGWGTFWEGRI